MGGAFLGWVNVISYKVSSMSACAQGKSLCIFEQLVVSLYFVHFCDIRLKIPLH